MFILSLPGVVANACNPATWRLGPVDDLRAGALCLESESTRFVKEGRTGRGRKRSRQKSPRQRSDGIALANEPPGTARSRNSDLVLTFLHYNAYKKDGIARPARVKTATTTVTRLQLLEAATPDDENNLFYGWEDVRIKQHDQRCPREAACRILKQTRCHASLIAVGDVAPSDRVSADLQKVRPIIE
ncbi:hypothetical protein T11_874 [Trichinella zimbabwensis]|uniref:Uncharacterized protein n=1 Tax=Trichinella zimbabwensis TaxID=268475 RepID=A0A0V1HWM3_9BILA|nr:hypothetical protein T11_874 [Trichinella zimbabwensis]